MPLPPHYLEVVMVSGMASYSTMVMNSRGGLQVLFVSFHQRSWRFPLCTHHHSLGHHIGTSIWHYFGWPIGSLSLGETSRFLMVVPPLKWVWMPYLPQILFDTFTKTLCVGNDNMTLTLHSLVGSLGIVAAPIINLSGRLVKPFLPPCPSPFGVVAFGESFPWGAPFLFEATQDHCTRWKPCGKEFGWHNIWLERWWWLSHCRYWSVCVGFPVYSNGQTTISLWFDNSVQEGDGTILLVVLYCKPYGRVNTVMCWRNLVCWPPCGWQRYHPHIPAPELGGVGAVLRAFCSKYSMYRLATMD